MYGITSSEHVIVILGALVVGTHNFLTEVPEVHAATSVISPAGKNRGAKNGRNSRPTMALILFSIRHAQSTIILRTDNIYYFYSAFV